MAEMSTIATASVYNQVYHIQKPDYSRDVTETSSKAYVLVLLTSSHGTNVESRILTEVWREMAQNFGDVKFCQMRADLCIEGYPDKNTPTVLVYKDGDIKKQIVTLRDLKGPRTSSEGKFCNSRIPSLHDDSYVRVNFSAQIWNKCSLTLAPSNLTTHVSNAIRKRTRMLLPAKYGKARRSRIPTTAIGIDKVAVYTSYKNKTKIKRLHQQNSTAFRFREAKQKLHLSIGGRIHHQRRPAMRPLPNTFLP